ncbi:MAG: tRNA (N6-isopentenyl adenosine(37)-C2)-methylthiotransferase MiaB [Oscillospiraceae bacterium]|nr:tRNA (N6-isopentenyl adenosine(37)-C2)-methylthiotransferase MiaB [Candidatus Limimonas coprohippi]MCQ2488653.1 tRNA (N6-isopentenyl adenosine(37)-C2)-methylthiotransferase MiaB [Clostridia bacterium]
MATSFVEQGELNLQFENCLKVKEFLKNHLGRTPLAFTHTYGCQGNVAEGERIDGMLKMMGYEFCDDASKADFVLFNTCAVREHAEERVFGNIGMLKKFKETNPNLIIAVCGCMVQQEHIKERLRKSFPYVDIVFGTHAIHTLPEHVLNCLTKEERVFAVPESDGVVFEGVPSEHTNTLKAFLPISYGCNNFCTYCVVPLVKGRERSRRYEDIINDAKRLVAEGFKEIMLIGQNVNSYGNDFGETNLFSKLLKEIDEIPGDFIIRFMTSHPKDCSFELIDTIAQCKKVEHHLHLPFQSGNDRVLKEMNRHYDRERYVTVAKYAKEKIPDIAITSDVIVGFPGETREEFLDTVSLIREVEFSSLYIFIYSPRVGTKAATMPDPITAEEKSARFKELSDAQAAVAEGRNLSMKGKTYRALIEGRNKAGRLGGRTSQNIMIEFDGPDELIGTFQNIKVTEPLTWILKGELQ